MKSYDKLERMMSGYEGSISTLLLYLVFVTNSAFRFPWLPWYESFLLTAARPYYCPATFTKMASQIRSSLALQVLIHCNKPYSVFLLAVLFILYLYKGTVLPYPNHVRILELLIILLFVPIEVVRLMWAARGNLTETPTFLTFSLLLDLAVLAISAYLAVFQNYVLLIEEILICIQGALVIIEVLLSVMLIASLSRPVTTDG